VKITLLAICGLSPKVITETVYALHQQGRKIDAVEVITTSEGKAACIARLFGSNDGYYCQYLEDYGIDRASIDFSPDNVYAVKDAQGVEIFDIDTERENELFLAACMEKTFELTKEPDAVVYFLISGGTKTMSACLSLAAQCYARPHDRIFHVLVTPEFDACRAFYYPPFTPQKIEVRRRDGKFAVMDTRDAEISLVAMPFFSLRHELSDEMLKTPETPASLMMTIVREEKESLEIQLGSGKLIWKGTEIDLPPRLLALYVFFARQKKANCLVDGGCIACHECYVSMSDILAQQADITGIYEDIAQSKEIEAMSNTGITSLSKENFNSYKSALKNSFEKRFGTYEAKNIAIHSIMINKRKKYGLKLQRDFISIDAETTSYI